MFTVLTIQFSWAWGYILLSQLVSYLGYDPLIVFWKQNHVTFTFIKMMSHDLLVQIAYFKDKANLWQPGQSKTQTELLLIQLQQWWARRTTPGHNFDYFILFYENLYTQHCFIQNTSFDILLTNKIHADWCTYKNILKYSILVAHNLFCQYYTSIYYTGLVPLK